MAQIAAAFFSLLFSLLTTASVDLESAFLQNRPELFLDHLSPDSRLSLTLPEPVGFSDQLSAEQSYFLFKDILDRFQTQEFYLEDGLPLKIARNLVILKARWAFRDLRRGEQHAFRLFVLLRIESSPSRSGRASPWKIMEIKAEKI